MSLLFLYQVFKISVFFAFITRSNLENSYFWCSIATCVRATRLAALETRDLRIRRSTDRDSRGIIGPHTAMEMALFSHLEIIHP